MTDVPVSQEEVEVTQADREAAASVAVLVEMRELILSGRADHHAEPFARHRQQAERDVIARMEGWRPIEAVAKIIDPDAWFDGVNTDGCGAYWHVRRSKAREKAASIAALYALPTPPAGEA